MRPAVGLRPRRPRRHTVGMDAPAAIDDLAPQPLLQATALPARFYAGAASAARDREAVFARSWQLLARSEQLAVPGDHVVGEVAGVPLLLVRGEDGVLRALHNVCRHRAGPLASCDGRAARRLRCQYHGWTYALDGTLRSAPDMQAAPGFDVSGVRLPQASVAEWKGLVFAALQPAMRLEELLEGIGERLGSNTLDRFRFHRRVAYDIACNWKVYVDNYLEGYHVPHIHPELNRMLDYRSYSTTCARWSSLQHSPLESTEALYGSGEALYWFVWPNIALNVLPARVQVNSVLPLQDDRCRVVFDYYYPADADPEALSAVHASDHGFSDLVQVQDVGMCETVQRNLASGSYVAGRLNPLRESGVHHFHELLRAAYRGEASREA